MIESLGEPRNAWVGSENDQWCRYVKENFTKNSNFYLFRNIQVEFYSQVNSSLAFVQKKILLQENAFSVPHRKTFPIDST